MNRRLINKKKLLRNILVLQKFILIENKTKNHRKKRKKYSTLKSLKPNLM